MTSQTESADLKTALTHAASLLAVNPQLAEEQALEILKVHSDSPSARRIQAAALRLQGKGDRALAIITPVAEVHNVDPNVRHEFALCLAANNRVDEAIEILRDVVRQDPRHALAWRSLGDYLNAIGDEQGSRDAYNKHIEVWTRHRELTKAAEHLYKKQLPKAEQITRDVLKKDPVDIIAIRMLATCSPSGGGAGI